MTKTLFALPLIAVLMATSALAQTSDTGTSGGSGTEGSSGNETGQSGTEGDTATSAIVAQEGAQGTGEAWPSNVGNTFFTGSDMTTLRSPEEVQSGWSSLSADEQARVRADCATYGGGAAGGTTGTSGSGESTAGTDTGTAGTSQTSATGTFPTGMTSANMTQICDWVNSF